MRSKSNTLHFARRAEPRRTAFTLIELLIVVAIIAVLAAIALPNFLEAQTRAKVARVKSDLRTTALGVECYKVDSNNYPPSFGVVCNGRDSLAVLSTPVAYVNEGKLIDVFAQTKDQTKVMLTYEGINSDNKIIEDNMKGAPAYTWISPSDPGSYPTIWWWTASRGPSGVFAGFAKGSNPTMEQAFYESDTNQAAWLAMVYDPSNGTTSAGNIYRAGGAFTGFAGQSMMR